MNYTFRKVTAEHQAIIFSWLDQPHAKEFWDNSQAHRDDILNFIEGRKTPSPYFNGEFDYWIGYLNGVAFCFMLTAAYVDSTELSELHRAQLSTTGETYSIDFCIGDLEHLGCGYAAPTLVAFMQFLQSNTSPQIDRFFIDPDTSNPRAIHVYEQAGFKRVGEFVMQEGFFKDHKSVLMIKDV